MKRIHPHVRHFIKNVVYAELCETIPTKKDWREGLMEELLTALLLKLEEEKEVNGYSDMVDDVVVKFKQQKLEKFLHVAERVLKASEKQLTKQQHQQGDFNDNRRKQDQGNSED